MQRIFSRVSICILVVISCLSILTATSFADNKAGTITVKPIKLSELKGMISANKKRVLIVDFWATWCPPCRKEIPGFVNLYKKYKDKGLEIIGVSVDQGGIRGVQNFVKQYGINYPVYVASNEIGAAYDIKGIPTTYIIDKNGKTKSRHVGYVTEAEFEREILPLLK